MSEGARYALSSEDRAWLEGVVRQRKAAGLVVRRANVLLLLDKGWTPRDVAEALYLDEETVRVWHRGFAAEGRASLELKGYSRREGHLTQAQEAELVEHLTAHPPRSVGEVRAHIRACYDVSYCRSGAIKLMGRLGFEYRKPATVLAVADEEAQRAFIEAYEALLNRLDPDEAVVFSDAVHPEHRARPAHGWFPKGSNPALTPSKARPERLNIQGDPQGGALDLETFAFQFVEAQTIDTTTTRRMLEKVEAAYPSMRVVHVFLDNAKYHHAKALRPWLLAPDRRVRLHFIPKCSPHLNAIERLWDVMHEHVTRNRHHATFGGRVRQGGGKSELA